MLQPKRTKFRRMQKGRMKGNAQRGAQLAFGSFGIKAMESTWITGRQIEAARQAIVRYTLLCLCLSLCCLEKYYKNITKNICLFPQHGV